MSDLLFSVFPNENFVDLGLYQYGWEQCAPAHSFGPAARNHYIFHYVISGTGTLLADDENGNTITWQVKSGQGFMLFPGQVNTYIADSKLPWEYTWVEFDGLRAREIVTTAGLSLNRPRLSCKFKGTSQPDDGRDALSEPSSRRISVSSNWTSLSVFRLFHAFCRNSSCEAKRKYPGFLY